MKSVYAKRQHGAALLAMLMVLALGASWYLVSRLNADSGMAAATRKVRNAEVLNRAKQALISYVATQAAEAGERNPGRLPCPEAAGYYGDPAQEGTASGNCTLPAVGRLPWRTLGLDKLMDAAGEPLWYVVSPGWALSNSTTPPLTTYINSNSTGQLLVNARSVSTLSRSGGTATAVSTAHGFRSGDIVKIAGATPAGYNVAASVTVTDANTFTYSVVSTLSTPATGSIKAGDEAVALIVAPGSAMNVTGIPGWCTARNQARSVLNALDYLECYDAANGVFATTGPATSFNDQVVRIGVADVMPVIEAAVANRIEREIAPLLKTVYGDALWGTSATTPAFPFPAAFDDPDSTTKTYQGQVGLYQGLLPFNYHSNSCGGVARCSSNVMSWTSATPTFSTSGGPGYIPAGYPPSCYWSGSTRICEGYYYGGAMNVSFTDRANNITTGLRTFTAASHNGTYQAWRWNGSSWIYLGSQPATTTRSLLSASGAVNFVTSAPLPSITDWGYYLLSRNRPADSDFADHALLDANDAVTGWFARNEWYRLLYYAIAQGHAPGGSLSCISGGSGSTGCLQVTNLSDATKQRAILALAGRSLISLSQTRPSSALQNYLDSVENQNADTVFVQSAVGRSFNDRFVSVNKNP